MTVWDASRTGSEERLDGVASRWRYGGGIKEHCGRCETLKGNANAGSRRKYEGEKSVEKYENVEEDAKC